MQKEVKRRRGASVWLCERITARSSCIYTLFVYFDGAGIDTAEVGSAILQHLILGSAWFDVLMIHEQIIIFVIPNVRFVPKVESTFHERDFLFK